MKTARRHELRENDLAQQIGALVELLRRHGVAIFVGLVLLIVAAVAANMYAGNRAATLEEGWSLLTKVPDAISPKPEERVVRYRELADKNLDPTLSVMAVKSASEAALIALADARKRNDNAAALRLNEEAKRLFERLGAQGDSLLVPAANARLGLGFLAEDRGDYAEAESIYKDMQTQQRFRDSPFAAQAQFRLEHMAKWREKIVFAPASRPASAPAAASASAPANVLRLPPVMPPVAAPHPAATQPAATKK